MLVVDRKITLFKNKSVDALIDNVKSDPEVVFHSK